MFDVNEIYTNPAGERFLINLDIGSAEIATKFAANFSIRVREKERFADLYSKGPIIIIDTPKKKTTIEIANYLNEILQQISL